MQYYHAVMAGQVGTSNYELFDKVILAKPRRDAKHT
jgi:hypothetical protein